MKVKTPNGSIRGLVIGLRSENNQEFCEIQFKDGKKENYLINDIIDYDISFGTFEDVILHISGKNNTRHCGSCYLSTLYALDLLENLTNSQSLSIRRSVIKYGIINYLGEEYSQAAYNLIPQSEAILNEILLNEGFLEEKGAFFLWTSNHPNLEYRRKRSTDLVDRIRGTISIGDKSRLKPFINRVDLLAIACVTNKLAKFKLNKIQEHELSSVIILLHALYHATLTKPSSSDNTEGKPIISPKGIAGVFYHGIDFDKEDSWYPRMNLLNAGALYTPDYIAYLEPNLGAAHTSIHNQEIEYIKYKAFCGLGALTPREGNYVWGASLIRSGFHLFKGSINPTQLTQEEEAKILEKSDIEIKFEEIRRKVNPNAASRLNCIFIADNAENVKRMFEYSPSISILEVSVPAAIRFTKVDSRWYEEYHKTHDEKNIENYWRGIPFEAKTETWEYLVDGVVRINNPEKLKYVIGDDREL